MNWMLEVVLIAFALVGFGGTGASLAVARCRRLEEGSADIGMLGVAAMLALFASVCTAVAVGVFGVAALGAVAVWCSYIVMARQIGMFALEVQARSELTTLSPPARQAPSF